MRLIIILLVLTSLLIRLTGTAVASPPEQRPSDQQLIDQIKQITQNKVRVTYHPKTGKVNFIGTDLTHTITQPGLLPSDASPEAAARGFLAQYGQLFGLKDPASELKVIKQKTLNDGRGVVRFQQRYKDIPIVGGELMIQVDAKRNIIAVNGEILPDLELDITPVISADTARQTAIAVVAKTYNLAPAELVASPPELWIYNPALLGGPGPRFSSLVWRTEITPLELRPIREFVLVEAKRGGVVLTFNQIETAKNRRIYDNNNNPALGLPGNGPVRAEGQGPSGIIDVDRAYDYSGHTYDFYLTNHGRDSLDGAGMTLTSTTRYCEPGAPCPYPNAFWNGVQMVYGQGFANADDVVGHELTHGVTDFESSLFYYYQAGAINESLSDVWGEFVDLTNSAGNDNPGVRWQLGEDISGGANRNMQNPPAFGDPDRMTSPNYYTGALDSGGVHTNSGVNNKATFLMTDGGTFNGQTVTGLGITKVANIYYEAQTNLLVSGADYADLYNVLYQACLNLVGTAGITNDNCQEVGDATNAVEMNQQPVSEFNTDVALCATGQISDDLFLDDLESGAGNWVFGAVSGSNRWQWDSPYGAFAHSGRHFLYADDYPPTTTDSYAAMKNSITLPAGAYLHFSHAYGFEGPAFDGGVLEYSTNGGASWNDAGSLFDFNGYDGTLSAGNPLGSRSAFLNDSHGYISSRLNLASLAGQSVRFRWRMGLDFIGFDWGWWVDDVRIYTCSATPSTYIYLPIIIKGGTIGSGLVNGNFESGPTGWTTYSTHGWPLIVTSFPGIVTPHSGSWAVWLGGDYDDISYIQQQVTVPSGSPYLAYWHWIASADVCGYDFGGVIINGSTVVNVYNLCSSTNTGGWVKHVVNLGAYAGQSVSLQIRAETDSSFNSNLFVDDVSFQPTATVLETSGPNNSTLSGLEDTLPKPDKLTPTDIVGAPEPEFFLRPDNWAPKGE